MRVNYAIVFVSNMERSIGFYKDLLGVALKFESPGWTEFATEGTTLALHKSKGSISAGEGQQEIPGRCRPGLGVPDLDEFHARMIENKVSCTQEPREVFGARIAQYLDPDGLTISVSEDSRAR